ncbi:MAG: gluconate 2-dehydrogenase subunit 3 family protein [Acidimicrobiales bacterium]
MDHVSRRAFLASAGSLSLLALLDRSALAKLAQPGAGEPGYFLTAGELDTLRAVTGRFLPGPPFDPDPGAIEAGTAEAIDLLLGAFSFDPPIIHAGGPFSDRAGAGHDDFADFHPLDRLAELGWRIRIEGTLGLAEREFAGPVRGLQQIYREGLAHLDERTSPVPFATALAPVQDLVLLDVTDSGVQELVGVALANTLEAFYGPPEYGGNRGLAGWTPIGWPGDAQPRGFSDAEVSDPDPNAGLLVASVLLDGATAQAALDRFLPALAGQARSTSTWWAAGRGRVLR